MRYLPYLTATALLTLTYQAQAEETPNTASSVTLEAINVQGRALSHYKEEEASLGLRTATDIDKTPQSVQVIRSTLIEDQGARQVTDLYRSISGVTQDQYSTVMFRGFRQDEIMYDGLRGDPFNGFAIPQLFNIDEVQILKGPSGALYGAGQPGGIINYVTKKPSYRANNSVQMTVGNQDFVSSSIESSGPVNEDATQRYRVGIYGDKENSFRNNVDTRNEIIDLGYSTDLTDDTTATVQFTHIDQHINGARLRGIATDDHGNFLADTRWNANESDDYQDLEADVLQGTLEYALDNHFSGNSSIRYFENEEVQKYHEVVGLSDSNDDGINDYAKRQYRDQLRASKGLSIANNLIAELDQHTLLFGLDYYHLDSDFLYYRANNKDGVTGLSLTTPIYGVDDTADYNMNLKTDESTTLNRIGALVQDQWHINNQLDLVAGVRLDRYEEDYKDHKSDHSAQYDDTGYSARIGATYEVNQQLKPYVSLSTGYVPQEAADQQSSVGGPFDPEESQQIEAGLRSYWFNNKLNANIAVYHIIRENILQEDPSDSDKLIAFGEVRSQGVELDIMADITPRWVANVSYAYNDTRITESGDDGVQYSAGGDRFANAPHHQLGLWTRYDFPTLNSAISFGADYISERYNRQGQTVKPYTIYDASWQTTWQDWTLQATIKNITDETYASSGFTQRIGSYVGEPRRVYLSAKYQF